jgi:hypothetical protein
MDEIDLGVLYGQEQTAEISDVRFSIFIAFEVEIVIRSGVRSYLKRYIHFPQCERSLAATTMCSTFFASSFSMHFASNIS